MVLLENPAALLDHSSVQDPQGSNRTLNRPSLLSWCLGLWSCSIPFSCLLEPWTTGGCPASPAPLTDVSCWISQQKKCFSPQQRWQGTLLADLPVVPDSPLEFYQTFQWIRQKRQQYPPFLSVPTCCGNASQIRTLNSWLNLTAVCKSHLELTHSLSCVCVSLTKPWAVFQCKHPWFGRRDAMLTKGFPQIHKIIWV